MIFRKSSIVITCNRNRFSKVPRYFPLTVLIILIPIATKCPYFTAFERCLEIEDNSSIVEHPVGSENVSQMSATSK